MEPLDTGNRMNKQVDAMDECRRCGTCCRKGGPALHLQDQHLVESGRIPLKDLFTIRQGEPAYDNVVDAMTPAPTDIIKIQNSEEGNPACRYYLPHQQGCEIYDDRPVECSTLTCWDTHAIQSLYNQDRLTRRHLLSKAEAVWDLVTDHQQHCSYNLFAKQAAEINKGLDIKSASEVLLEMIRFDQSLRKVVVEKTGLDKTLLLFLFGRPLTVTMGFFKVKLVGKTSGLSIQPFIVQHT
jgi:Fe-S-cluster containining protein